MVGESPVSLNFITHVLYLVSNTARYRSTSRSRSRSPDRRRTDQHRLSRSPSYDRERSPRRRRSYSRSRSRSPRRRSHSPNRSNVLEDDEVTDTFIRAVAAEVKGHGSKYEQMLKEREKGNSKYRFMLQRDVGYTITLPVVPCLIALVAPPTCILSRVVGVRIFSRSRFR